MDNCVVSEFVAERVTLVSGCVSRTTVKEFVVPDSSIVTVLLETVIPADWA